MRILIFGIIAVGWWLLDQSTTVFAQRYCAGGTRTTLTGTIVRAEQKIDYQGKDFWTIDPSGLSREGCVSDSLFGYGRLPIECSAGRRFTASGRIEDLGAYFDLEVSSIQCR
ncbi:MAG: hypothetical protein WD073_09400 [Xanthobacteraceae bacterium]